MNMLTSHVGVGAECLPSFGMNVHYHFFLMIINLLTPLVQV